MDVVMIFKFGKFQIHRKNHQIKVVSVDHRKLAHHLPPKDFLGMELEKSGNVQSFLLRLRQLYFISFSSFSVTNWAFQSLKHRRGVN